jgi:outer membrane receptor for ferrienterochelin and colicins
MVMKCSRTRRLTRAAAAAGLVLLLRGASPSVLAAETGDPAPPPDLTGLDLQELLGIDLVYGASRWEQKVAAAPASVSLVTADDIRRYGYTTLAEILSGVQGLYTTYDRDYSYIGVRGFQRPGDFNGRILILVDGHRLNDSVYESVLIGTDGLVNVEDIERVEVIRGPSSSIYGASAFLAVINIVTRRGGDLGGFEASAGAASYDSESGRVAWGRKAASGAEALVSASGYGSGGQDLFYEEFNDPATNNGVAVDADRDANQRMFAKVSRGPLTLEAAYSSREKRIPTGAYGTVFNDPRSRTLDNRGFLDLKYDRAFDSGSSVTGRLYADRYYYRGTYISPPPSDVYVEHAWAYTRGADLQYNARLGAHNTLVSGGEFRNHDRQDFKAHDGTGDLDDLRRSASDWGIFVEDEFAPSKRLAVNAGLRYDDYPAFGGSTNPRLAVILTPGDASVLKFLYGRAFRAPSTYELYYSGLANPDLVPESIDSLEVVFDHFIGRSLLATASVFRNRIDRLITYSGVTGVFENLQAVDSRGVEVGMEERWAGDRRLRVDYAYQDTTDTETGGRLSDSPRNLAKLHLDLPVLGRRFVLGTEILYTGRRLSLAGDEIGGFGLVNLTLLGRNLAPGLDLSLGVYNLLDKRHADPAPASYAQDAIEQDGRHLRFRLTWRF